MAAKKPAKKVEKAFVDLSVNEDLGGAPLPVEYDGADTRDAAKNLATRSNIVRD